ncbi:hypothetical protein [Alsobacter sp. SYSU BS001988]
MSKGQSQNDLETLAPGPSFYAETWGADPWAWPPKDVWHPWGKIPPLLPNETALVLDFSAIIESERPAPLKGAFEKERVGQCTVYRPTAWRR